MKNVAIILAGGVGSRMKTDVPKQYCYVNNQPVIKYCFDIFLKNDKTDAIILGVSDEWKEFVCQNVLPSKLSKPVYFSEAGETRQYTIYNALILVKTLGYSDDDIVIIHDSARPLVSDKLINECYDACLNADAVLPVIPVKDTQYLSEDGKNIQSLLNRNHLWCGQSPESFRFGKYLKAHESMSKNELLSINGSTELAYKSGLFCQMITGDPMNFKITTPEDLSNFKSIIGNTTTI